MNKFLVAFLCMLIILSCSNRNENTQIITIDDTDTTTTIVREIPEYLEEDSAYNLSFTRFQGLLQIPALANGIHGICFRIWIGRGSMDSLKLIELKATGIDSLASFFFIYTTG